MTHDCKAFRNFDKSIESILLFGLVFPVVRSAPARLEKYCSARDEYGNVYDIYTDYDPCLAVSETVAVKRKEV